ncbi:MAG: hypothetical protein ABIC04_03800 [Nanoarchaeota archaeon]
MAQMAYKKLVESGAEIHHAPDPDTLPQGLDPDRLQLVFGAYFGGVEDPNCVNRLLAAFKNSKNSYKARVYEPATLYIEHIL